MHADDGSDSTRAGTGAALVAFALFVLIAVGSYVAWQRLGGEAAAPAHTKPWAEIAPGVKLMVPGDDVKDNGEKIEVVAFMRESRYASQAQHLKRVEVVAIAGHAHLDLSETLLDATGGRIEAVVIAGRADIRVPNDWTVKTTDTMNLGALDNTAREGGTDPAKVVRLETVIMAGEVHITH
jgi:predicted membrane protein